MTVASGTRPYEYERYPFILQTGELIGISGILLEEPMFTTLAERDIYAAQTGTDRYFYKYYGANYTRVPIEPAALGRNLDGTNQNPISAAASQEHAGVAGCVNFKDYVLDIRTSIEDIWDKMAEHDCDYDAATLKIDYFSGIFNGERLTADWVHDQTALGESGALVDIDLREIQYQPIIRFSRWQPNSYWDLPIWPAFCSPVGGLPALTVYDIIETPPAGPSLLPGINESGYAAVSNGEFLLIGDMFVVSNSKAYIYSMKTGNRASANTALCSESAARTVNQPMDRGIGYFQHGNYGVGTGLYRMSLFQSAPSPTLHVSGISSFWPPTSYDLSDFDAEKHWKYSSAGGFLRASGLHIFNEGFWGVGGGGQILYSPINTQDLWLRTADDTSETSAFGFTYTWGTSYFHDASFWTHNVKSGPWAPQIFEEYAEVASWDIDGTYLGYTTSQQLFTADPRDTGPIVDLINHTVGLSFANYTILQGWEGSDGATRFPIWDGSKVRGTIIVDGFGVSQNSPGINGTIDGTGFCSSPHVGANHPRYFIPNTWYQTRDVFPLPPASGNANAAAANAGAVHYIVYGENIHEDFEQMDQGSYSHAGRPIFIQPEGDLDIGDGSAFMQFNGKLKGEASSTSFIGRIINAVSGSESQIQIIDYWPGATISRCGEFT